MLKLPVIWPDVVFSKKFWIVMEFLISLCFCLCLDFSGVFGLLLDRCRSEQKKGADEQTGHRSDLNQGYCGSMACSSAY